MKKITLRNLPPEIQRLIKRKALNEDISREDAIIEILRDAELQHMVEHDVAFVKAQFDGDDKGL